ncbi:MAG: hypothetical protein Q7S00_02580 [bacterium]|nr:hypothetical protein [bacterium]
MISSKTIKCKVSLYGLCFKEKIKQPSQSLTDNGGMSLSVYNLLHQTVETAASGQDARLVGDNHLTLGEWDPVIKDELLKDWGTGVVELNRFLNEALTHPEWRFDEEVLERCARNTDHGVDGEAVEELQKREESRVADTNLQDATQVYDSTPITDLSLQVDPAKSNQSAGPKPDKDDADIFHTDIVHGIMLSLMSGGMSAGFIFFGVKEAQHAFYHPSPSIYSDIKGAGVITLGVELAALSALSLTDLILPPKWTDDLPPEVKWMVKPFLLGVPAGILMTGTACLGQGIEEKDWPNGLAGTVFIITGVIASGFMYYISWE